MDSSLSPVAAMRDGEVEALTVTPAFFKSGQQGGWLGTGAVPQRRGETFVSEMQHARHMQPKILLVTQWNEWAGAPDGNSNAYTDDYNLTLSNEIEPVSLTECGGYVHKDDKGQLPVCNTGYGFRNLNVLAATLQVYRDDTQVTREATTVVRLGPVVVGPSDSMLSVNWSVMGTSGAVELTIDGLVVAKLTNSSSAKLDTRRLQLKHGPHNVCVHVVGGWSRFKLAEDERDVETAMRHTRHPSVDCVSATVGRPRAPTTSQTRGK